MSATNQSCVSECRISEWTQNIEYAGDPELGASRCGKNASPGGDWVRNKKQSLLCGRPRQPDRLRGQDRDQELRVNQLEPVELENARLPCFMTVTPQAATTTAAMVLMLDRMGTVSSGAHNVHNRRNAWYRRHQIRELQHRGCQNCDLFWSFTRDVEPHRKCGRLSVGCLAAENLGHGPIGHFRCQGCAD